MRPEPLKEATQGGGIVACVSGVGIYVSSYTQWVVWLRLLVRLLVSGRGLGLAGGVPPLNLKSKQLRKTNSPMKNSYNNKKTIIEDLNLNILACC